MGKARRRHRRLLQQAGETIHGEGQGIYALHFCRFEMIMEMIAEGGLDAVMEKVVRGGLDQEAVVYCAQTSEHIRAAPGREMKCFTCDSEFSGSVPPAITVFMHALNAQVVISHGLCRACADKPMAELQTFVTDAYRTQMIPGLRVLPPFSSAGRA